MISNLEPYEAFIDSITSRVPLLRTAQLKVMVYKYFEDREEDMTPALAEMIVFACQRRGKLLLSDDGWAMTKGQYKRLILNREEEHIDVTSTFRIRNMDALCRNYNPGLIDLMWIVAYEMPKSCQFVISSYPFQVQYIQESREEGKSSKLFQLFFVKKGEELAVAQMLRSLPSLNRSEQAVVRRIALMEDEKMKDWLPKTGISHICIKDDSIESHYRILEARGSDRWSDVSDA